MSNKKADGTQMVNGVAVVAPENMGKGLTWDEATNTYYVDINSELLEFDKKTGKLAIRVSKLEGNVIQAKEDGIYVGNKSPKEVEVLYVDAANGVDQDPYTVKGAGTRAKPLRTLPYAVSLMFPGTPTTVYLHTHQVHEWSSSQIKAVKGSLLRLLPYSDQFDVDYHTVGGEYSQNVINYIRNGNAPVVRMSGVSTSYYPSVLKTQTLLNRSVCSLRSNGLSAEGIVFRDVLSDTCSKHAEAVTDAYTFTDPNRIKCDPGAVISLYRCKLESEGEPVISPSLNQTRINNYKTQALDKQVFTLGFVLGRGLTLTLHDLYGVPENACVVGNSGWAEKMTSATSIGLRSVGITFDGDKVKQVTSRVFDRVVNEQNGVKQVLAPVVDIDPQLW